MDTSFNQGRRSDRDVGHEEMIQAVGRWLEFDRSQSPADHEGAEIRRRLDRGEGLLDYLDPDGAARAIRAFARGVGLTDDAYSAFILGVSAILRGYENQPPEQQRDTSAVIGLLVGLTARRLADQRSPD